MFEKGENAVFSFPFFSCLFPFYFCGWPLSEENYKHEALFKWKEAGPEKLAVMC
jgi:hypothetical protein